MKEKRYHVVSIFAVLIAVSVEADKTKKPQIKI